MAHIANRKSAADSGIAPKEHGGGFGWEVGRASQEGHRDKKKGREKREREEAHIANVETFGTLTMLDSNFLAVGEGSCVSIHALPRYTQTDPFRDNVL